jgi:hypothetical protein
VAFDPARDRSMMSASISPRMMLPWFITFGA